MKFPSYTAMSSSTMDPSNFHHHHHHRATASSSPSKPPRSVPMHEGLSDRSTPLLIRTPRATTSLGAVVPSMDCHPTRRLDKRDHRSLSGDWISSPLFESFASFHNALTTVSQHDVAASGTSNAIADEVGTSLPYVSATYWPPSQGGSDSSRFDSSRTILCRPEPVSTPVGSVSTGASTSLSSSASSFAMEDWDMLKMRSLSTDLGASPVPIDNFVPFLFPMDPDHTHPHGEHDHPQDVSYPPHHTQYPSHQHAGYPFVNHDVVHHPPHGGGVYAASSHCAVSDPPSQPKWIPNRLPPQLHHSESHATEGATEVVYTPAYTDALPQMMVYSPPVPPQMHHHDPMYQSTMPVGVSSPPPMSLRPPSHSSGLPPADVQLLTKLNSCYWKNGRKNLQCFPICPEHNDFYSMKMSNRKHTSVGVCRGPVYTQVFLPASAQPPASATRTMGQHMKYEFGVGASGSGGSAYEVFVLGNFERVPQRDDNEDLERLLPPPIQFTESVAFESFRYSCFQAVEMEERRLITRSSPDIAGLPDQIVRSTWFFLPDVWKVQPMLKKKRKATRSSPAQAFPFCFRVFAYIRDPQSTGDDARASYRCIASTVSTFFELYSTRTVDRVKRKYWGQAEDEEQDANSDDALIATTPYIAKRPMHST